jgi:predicted acylesterase/phospholipase RssA
MRPVQRNYLAQFFDACRVLRPSLITSLFAFMALSLPLQTREVYRVLADDFPNQRWQVAYGFIGLLAAAGFIWHCGRQSTLLERRHVLADHTIEGTLLRWMPRLLAALVPLGAALGLYTTIKEARTTASLVKSVADKQNWPELNDVYRLIDVSPARLWMATLICIGLVVLVLLATIFRTRGKSWKYTSPGRWLIGTETTGSSVLMAGICVALFSIAPPSLAQSIGVVAIFAMFLIVLVVVLSNLFLLSDNLGIPVISISLVLTVLLSASEWNDNHKIPLMRHKRDTDATTDVGRSFGLWFRSRADRDYYGKSSEPYPVFIVAAAGGGAYAAHYTATYLARMQDSCPNFAQHVFAISGVSGGSIGASLFAGLAKLKARNEPYVGCNLNSGDRYFERRTQKFFEQDFLSPVMAAALFPDLLQRFLPFPVGPFDRSRALDSSIEAAWHDMIEDAAKEDISAKALPSPFERPFLDLWTPARADEAVPALIINTTEVANGYRIVMSPIGTGVPANKQWSKIARLHSLLPPSKDAGYEADVKLSTAAGMSARFPWVLPAATVETGPDRKPMRLVDGGYVESSGVDSASQLLKALKVAVDRTKDTPDAINAKFYLVVLMGYEGTPVEDRSLGAPPLPLRTLINTWQTRAEIAFLSAFVDACPEIGTCLEKAAAETSYRRALVELPVIPVFLNLRDFALPLTWQLTQASREIIALHAGTAQRCERNDTLMMTWPNEAGPFDRIVKALGENSCSLCTMQFRLAHRTESPDWADKRICTRAPTPPPATTTSAITAK